MIHNIIHISISSIFGEDLGEKSVRRVRRLTGFEPGIAKMLRQRADQTSIFRPRVHPKMTSSEKILELKIIHWWWLLFYFLKICQNDWLDDAYLGYRHFFLLDDYLDDWS